MLPFLSGTMMATIRAPKLVTQTSQPFLLLSLYRSVFLPVNSIWKSALLSTGASFSEQAVRANMPAMRAIILDFLIVLLFS